MEEKMEWSGKYRNIYFKICNFDYGDGKKDKWTFYVYINLNQMPRRIAEKLWLKPKRTKFPSGYRTHYDYYVWPFKDMEFHGGITWYSKQTGFDKNPRIIQVGCDYMHLWDAEQLYNQNYIESDVKQCIDSLYRLIPNIKQPCRYCGKFMAVKEENPIHESCQIKSDEFSKKYTQVKS